MPASCGLCIAVLACAEPAGAKETSQQSLLKQHNAARAKRRRKPLRISKRLQRIAQATANELARRGTFAHDVGGGFSRRLHKGGYNGSAGENLAKGQRTTGGAVRAWLRSRGHQRNLLDRKFRTVGFGVARDRKGRRIYVAIYGTQ